MPPLWEIDMPKNPPPACPNCGKPMHFIPVKTFGRKFRCIGCDAPNPLQDDARGTKPRIGRFLSPYL